MSSAELGPKVPLKSFASVLDEAVVRISGGDFTTLSFAATLETA